MRMPKSCPRRWACRLGRPSKRKYLTHTTSFVRRLSCPQTLTSIGELRKVTMSNRKWYCKMLNLGFGIALLSCLCPGMAFSQSSGEVQRLYAQYQSLYVQGRFAEAVPLVERMLEITVKSQGEQSEDASTCYNNLGLLYWQMGDYDKAEAVYQHAFAISLEVLGGKNLSAAAGYNNLGALYQAKGDYGKAAPFMLKALVIYQELHGEKHSDTASAYGNLGMLYRKTGDYPKSEQFMRKALDICQEVLGDKDPATAGALNNLGQLYEDMGDYGKAEPLMQKALSIQKRGPWRKSSRDCVEL